MKLVIVEFTPITMLKHGPLALRTITNYFERQSRKILMEKRPIIGILCYKCMNANITFLLMVQMFCFVSSIKFTLKK